MNDVEVTRQSVAERDRAIDKIKQEVLRKSAADLLNEFTAAKPDTDEIKSDINAKEDAARVNQMLPKEVRTNKIAQVNNVVVVVRQTLEAINQPDKPLITIPDESVSILKLIAANIPLALVNQNNAVFIYELINRGMQGQLNAFNNLVSVFESLKLLKYLDETLHNKITRILQTRAIELGADPNDIKNKLTTERQKNIDSQEIKSLSETENMLRATAIKSIEEGVARVDGLQLVMRNSEEYKKIEETYSRIRRETNRPDALADLDKRKADDVQKLETRIRANLKVRIANLISIPKALDSNLSDEELTKRRRELSIQEITPQDIENNVNAFQSYLDSIQLQGIIDESSYIYLRNHSEEVKQTAGKLKYLDQQRASSTFYNDAERLMPKLWESKRELLMMLGSDDTRQFKEYIQKYNNLQTIEDWEEFVGEIRSLFEHIFQQAEANPKRYWQEAFVEFYEGHFYKQLVGALRALGESIEKDEELSTIKVNVWDFTTKTEMEADPELNKLSPSSYLVGKVRRRLLLSDAISNILANQMIDVKDFTEFARNVNVLTAQGAGFDKLAEFTAQLRMSDVIRMFHSIPGLTDAYNLYLENMQLELALNNHIFREDFGDQKAHNLDRTEFMTYHQLAASLGIPTDENPKKPNLEIIRLIRLASGIAKGVTGEFWGTAWTSALPHSFEIIREEGKEDRYKTLRTYRSLSHPGIEKMMPSIDIWLSMERFGIPTPWKEIGSAFLPRDLSDPPSDFFWYKHGDIYKWNDIRDAAQYIGRTDELADFDDQYQFAMEMTRTASVDTLLRGGWRFYEYRNFLIFQKENGEFKRDQSGKYVLDFKATMKQLAGVGPYYVKLLIDDLFDPHTRVAYQETISELDISNLGKAIFEELDWAEQDEINKKLGKITTNADGTWNLTSDKKNDQKKDQKKILKTYFYQKYIFEQLARYRPSHFLAMETKRWTPQDEVKEGRMVGDRLVAMLKSKFPGVPDEVIKDHYLPLYLGAVQLAEKEVWDEHKKEWRELRRTQDKKIWSKKPEDDPLNYAFNEHIFEGEAYESVLKKKLITYFKMRKEFSGVTEYPQGFFSIDDENFLANVKDFTKTLLGSINEDRWSRVKLHDEEHEEKIVGRYSKMLTDNKGYIGHYLKGNFLDLSELHLQQAGSRQSERMFGETANVAGNVTKEMQTVIFDSLLALTRREYKDIHEFEQAVEKTFGEPFTKISAAITQIDRNTALSFVQNWILICAELLSLDRRFRIKGVGNMLLDYFRRSQGTQGSFMTDKIPHTLRTPSTALDSQMLETFIHTISEAVGFPRTERNIKGYKDLKVGGLTLIKDFLPEFDKENPNSVNLEQMVHAMGADRWTQLKESAPMLVPIIIIIIAFLAKLAADKDKKK